MVRDKNLGGGGGVMPMVRTLHEFLVGVLLEEGIVANRPGEVVDHQLNNRLDLILCIARVEADSFVLDRLR